MYGKLIKTILKKYDLSQVELGKSLILSESFMSRLVHDKAPLPKNRQIQLTEQYNVNPAYFLKGEGEMFLDEQEKTTDAKSQFQKELNLTESEFQELVKFIEEDKYTLFLFIKAKNGDKAALDTLKKLLSI